LCTPVARRRPTESKYARCNAWSPSRRQGPRLMIWAGKDFAPFAELGRLRNRTAKRLIQQHYFHSLTNRAVTVHSRRRIGKEGRFLLGLQYPRHWLHGEASNLSSMVANAS